MNFHIAVALADSCTNSCISNGVNCLGTKLDKISFEVVQVLIHS